MTRIVELLTRLSGWVAATSGADIAAGLSRSHAFSRAEELRKELLGSPSGAVSAMDLDEESKDAIYALVDLLEVKGSGRRRDAFAQANAAYQYLADSSWVPDEFGERRDLMRRCARLGWEALGRDINKVEAIRTNPGPGQYVSFELCLPDAVRRKFPGISTTVERGRQLAMLANFKPAVVATGMVLLYEENRKQNAGRRILDVPEYLLGAVALQAGSAFRMAGAPDSAEGWLNRAAEHFAKTTCPESLFVRVLCERLVLAFERHQPREACEWAPKLISETNRLGMRRDFLRCRLVFGAALRVRGLYAKAIEVLYTLKEELNSEAEPLMLSSTLGHLADALTAEGRFHEAESVIEEAYRVNEACGLSLGKPHLDSVYGQLLRRQGRLPEAIEAFQRAASEYADLGAQDYEAEVRISLAESLAAANRHREAEVEIKRAVPTLEQHGLVVEALAALMILRDSIRQRKLDPEIPRLHY